MADTHQDQENKHIEGIYNYCDRWCEKCPKTEFCMLFQKEEEYKAKHDSEEGSEEGDSEEILSELTAIFKDTIALFEEESGELGINIAQMTEKELNEENLYLEGQFTGNKEPKDDAELTYRERIEKARSYTFSLNAQKYAKDVNIWFDENKPILNAKDKSFDDREAVGVDENTLYHEAVYLQNFIDIIYRYQTLIPVKLARAADCFLESQENEEDQDFLTEDKNGSAKLALICIDKSIEAWMGMMNEFSDAEDSILHMLVMLERVKKEATAFFPDALAFVRKGLDD